MADARFLNNLKFYPKDEINAEMVDLLVPYFNFPYVYFILFDLYIKEMQNITD